MNPKSYCAKNGIKTNDFIAKAREVAPKYDKVVHSIVSNPERGAALAPHVAAHIQGDKQHRTKPCSFTLRLTNEDSAEFNSARAAMGHSIQQALEYAKELYIEKAGCCNTRRSEIN